MPRFLTLFILFLLALRCPAEEMGAQLFQTVCAACHGPKGEGKDDLKTPSIANLPEWYVLRQLTNFHEGRRGENGQVDPQGALMAAIAKTLKPEQMTAVANHVQSLALVVPKERTLEGAQVQAGQELFYERCMECHRYNASGEMAFGSPPLIGRQAWYLADQLKKFKSRRRGAVHGDENGAKMVQTTNSFIEDDQMLRDVVAYIITLNPDPDASKEEQERQIIEGSPFESAGR